MKKFLSSLFSDNAGNVSSKRMAGFILLIAGIVLAFTGGDYRDMLIIAASLIGLGVADNFINILKK